MSTKRIRITVAVFLLASVLLLTSCPNPDFIYRLALPSYPMGEWMFSGSADDSSGNGRDGTVTGASLIEDRFGDLKSAYRFNSGDDISIPFPDIVNGDKISVSFWIQTDNAGSLNGNPVAFNNGATTSEYRYFFDSTMGDLSAVTFGDGMSLDTAVASWPENTWNHIVVTFDTGTGDIDYYFNGVLKRSNIFPAPDFSSIATTNLRLGSWNMINFYGDLDDLRIYDRVLTQEEIDQLYLE